MDGATVAAFGSVKVGGLTLPLYASSRNVGPPVSQQQFVYAPLFAPAVGPAGGVLARGPARLPSGKYMVTVDLQLSTPAVDALAFAEVKQRVPGGVLPRNVYVWPVRWVRLGVPADVQARFPSLELSRAAWNLDGGRTVTVPLVVADKAAADALMADLGELSFDIDYAQTKAATVRGAAEVTAATVRRSDLFARLTGTGTEVYVRRHDLRELAESVREILEYKASIEDPARFNAALVGKLADRMEAKLTSTAAEFDTEKYKKTYRGTDLEPTVLAQGP